MDKKTPIKNDDKKEAMKAIKDEVLAFSISPLYRYRVENHYLPVIGEGSHDAKIVFVGEAPGQNEAKTGRPFCGAAGKILDELLSSIGLDRKTVYVTNILKDRPPANRDPQPEEIALYAPYLDRQLAIIVPKVLVTLGRFSMEYLFSRYGLKEQLLPISKMHGKVFKGHTPYGPVTLLPLYHPAVALYNRTSKETLLVDMLELKKFLDEFN
jgi:DNA polymerase